VLDRSSSEGIVVREVGPRDGLQSFPRSISVAERVALITRLVEAGLTRIEVGAFVRVSAVPQMAGTREVLEGLENLPGVGYEVLVPNERGAQLALQSGARALTAVIAASETFNQRNVGRSVDRSVDELSRIAQAARDAGATCSVDVATAFGCAYEGPVARAAVFELVRRVTQAGAGEVVLCDTTGMAAPNDIGALFGGAREATGDEAVRMGLHFHNTRGLGLANVMAGIEAGCRFFDASIGGLGGCPFSPGATGNISTEDLIHLLACLELPSGVSLDRLLPVARWFEETLGVSLPGQVMRSGARFARYAGEQSRAAV
jgi:hydroxymethylglutaryl-CoA lyase